MTRYLLSVAIIAAFASTTLRAEQPTVVQTSATVAPPEMTPLSTGQVAATPDMWFYEQELRRYDDPRNAIRAAAALKTAQRNARIATMQAYGMSNSRPLSGCDPVHGIYSPCWVSNGYQPYEWVGPGTTTLIYAPHPVGGN